MSSVLVTGGSGFIGSYCILQLLAGGPSGPHHRPQRQTRERRSRAASGGRRRPSTAEPAALQFFVADLENDAGWEEAVAGCDYVLHVASPFPSSVPKHEDELIVPAREGALRVLRASRDAGVKRVVLTSSFAAIGYGHGEQEAPFDETTWTNTDGADVRPYVKSEDARRARGLGFHRAGRRRARACPSSTRSASSVLCSVPTTRPRSLSCSA